VSITAGTGAGQVRTIVGNSTTQLTLDTPWDVIPDASSFFTITAAARTFAFEQMRGVVSAATATSLTDNRRPFPTADEDLTGLMVRITEGTGLGQVRLIQSNTEDTLTLAEAWSILPDATSRFLIVAVPSDHTDGVFRDPALVQSFADQWPGDDSVDGRAGTDLLFGGDGADLIRGGADSDLLAGEHARVTFVATGGAGMMRPDVITALDLGSGGNDRLLGGAGNDRIIAGRGDDYADGGLGYDLISGDQGLDELHAGKNGATIDGGIGNDIIHGADDAADDLTGGDGDDRIYGYAGNDQIRAGLGDDIVDAGAGDDFVEGDGGADLLLGGDDNDILYGHLQGTDGLDVDILYGDAEVEGAGDGADQLFGSLGNDLLFGGGDDDFIQVDGQVDGPNTDTYDLGSGDTADPTDFTAPTLTPNPVLDLSAPVEADAAATLPDGPAGLGRWAELSGSATGRGLGAEAGLAVAPAVAVAADGTRWLAWADSRSGEYQVYVARHNGSAWQQLGGSAEQGGVTALPAGANRPALLTDATGNPIVAWTRLGERGADIQLARWDGAGWAALGGSLDDGGISGSNAADHVQLVMTDSGPVAAWLDASSGQPQVYLKRFDGAAWVGLDGSDSGGGLSAAPAGVTDFDLAANGERIAVVWSAEVAGVSRVYLREFDGTGWTERAASASGQGLGLTTLDALTPTVAYSGLDLLVAWSQVTEESGREHAVQAVRHASAGADTWQDLGLVSSADAIATVPRLASGGGAVHLVWQGATTAGFGLFASRFDGAAFSPELPADAAGLGISPTGGAATDLDLAVDGAGRPFLAWQEWLPDQPGGNGLVDAEAGVVDYPSAVLAQGPAGYWRLDGDAADSSGAGQDGSLVNGVVTGGPSPLVGDDGTAATLDGSNDRIDLPAAVLDGAGDVTALFWMRSSDTTAALLSGANAGNDNAFLIYRTGATSLDVYTGQSSTSRVTFDGLDALDDTDWHMLSVVRDQGAGQIRLYVDGVLAGSAVADLATLDIADGGLVFGQEQDSVGGGFSSSQAYAGDIDELALFRRVLDAEAIAALYQVGEQGASRADAAGVETGTGTATIYARANDVTVGRVFTANAGGDIQAILDSEDLGSGDVIVVAAGIMLPDGFTLGAGDSGVMIVGGGIGAGIDGDMVIDGASNVLLQGLKLRRDITATGADGFTLAGNAIDGAVLISGSQDIDLRHNRIGGGLVLGDAAAPDGTPADSGHVAGNDLTGSTALHVAHAFDGLITENRLHGAGIGLRYDAPAALAGNDIDDNTTGALVSVGATDGLGFVGSPLGDSGENRIFDNATGVQLAGGSMQRQSIHDNATGVSG